MEINHFYPNGEIYGITMFYWIDDYSALTEAIFEKMYDRLMTDEEKKQAYLFYIELEDTDDVYVSYLTKCTTKYNKTEPFKVWYPMKIDEFKMMFDV